MREGDEFWCCSFVKLCGGIGLFGQLMCGSLWYPEVPKSIVWCTITVEYRSVVVTDLYGVLVESCSASGVTELSNGDEGCVGIHIRE